MPLQIAPSFSFENLLSQSRGDSFDRPVCTQTFSAEFTFLKSLMSVSACSAQQPQSRAQSFLCASVPGSCLSEKSGHQKIP